MQQGADILSVFRRLSVAASEIEKVAKKIIYVTHIHIENAKKLFDLFGI
jgi:hypothetical protein